MATPAFRAAGAGVFCANSVANPSTLACTAPAGRSVGDLLLCVTECLSITATVSTPSGWNLVSGFPKRSGTASGGSTYVFSRIADGTSADNCSPSWSGVTTGTSGDASGAVIAAWSGLTETLDTAVVGSGHSPITNLSSLPLISTVSNNTMVLGIAIKLLESAGQSATWTAWSERYDNSTTSGTGHIVTIADKFVAAGLTTVNDTVTWSATTSARDYEICLAFQSIMPTGAAARSETLALSAAGVRKTFGAALRSEVLTLAAAGVRKRLGAAALSGTVSFAAAGVRKRLGAAARPGTITFAASGVRKALGAVSLPETLMFTAAGVRKRLGAAARSEVLALVASGVRKTFGSAGRSETLTFTAAGFLKRVGYAARPETISFSAAGVRKRLGAASRSELLAFTAAGIRKLVGAASRSETFSFTAAGFVRQHIVDPDSGVSIALSPNPGDSISLSPLGATALGVLTQDVASTVGLLAPDVVSNPTLIMPHS